MKHQTTLQWVIVAGFYFILGLLIKYPVDDNAAALILFGAAASGFGSVVNYQFGSSKGSKDKSDFINKMNGGKG